MSFIKINYRNKTKKREKNMLHELMNYNDINFI